MVPATWQLVFGGLVLLPMTLVSEGVPDTLTVPQAAGFAVALGALVTGQMLVARKR
ncbi:hypothetical protein ABH935_010188 [Catenulispora sp. GAS73]|uniref:hypothetical protein n=1 Tax=Catenulispora sp. GAS73 TaxID=3156269 RepID=UPI00351649FF